MAKAPRTPQDRRPKGEKKKERHDPSESFVYRIERLDSELTVPYIENFEMGFIEDLQEQPSQYESQKFMFQQLLSDDEYEIYRRMNIGEMVDFMEAWEGESAITLGEL